MKTLITGATGDVGSKVVRRLLERGERPRVFVRDEAKARAAFGNGVEMSRGDLADAAALRSAMAGMETVFLVTSGPRVPFLDQLAADAAQAAGIEHIVKLSSLDVEQSLAIGAWHEKGEAAIRASGVPFTFVRPSGFMSNLLAWAPSIRNQSTLRSSTGDGRRPFIHSEDIAAVAVEALMGGNYIGKHLALTGPDALTFGEIAEKISAHIGRKLIFVPISDDEIGQRFAGTGASPEEVAAHVELWRAIRDNRLSAVTAGVRNVLGREPISMDEWLAEHANAFR